ncbi:MAG: hypothetical protein HY924_08180 [Elusimicrobia bacterium]|nr:hypothetical protein [Elusimicrobiota bacterium]
MNEEAPASLRRTEVAVRLLWLTPLSAAAGFHAYQLLGYILRFPETAAANAGRTGLELAFLAGLLWWVVGSWRKTVAAAKGELPLSAAWVYGRAVLAAGLAAGLVFFVLPRAREVQLLHGEAQNRDGLRLLRKSLVQHHVVEGRPADDPRLLVKDARYGLPKLPTLWDAWGAGFPHPPSSDVTIRYKVEFEDTGKWTYVSPTAKESAGALYVDCTHTDSIGTAWTAY